ncbi:hypothetical protein [Nocardioides sp.]|uniref:hypothetical protein n=1 Tax=Nocardioides sp. TaxID=35761 RepID=UPI0031FEFCE6|nr:hypothetical protein [Nocardioides sp.]
MLQERPARRRGAGIGQAARGRAGRWCAAVVLAALILITLIRCAPSSVESLPGGGDGFAAPTGTSTSFGISGHTTSPISPGLSAALDLELTNPEGYALSVTALTVSIREVTASRADGAHPCTVADFVIRQPSDDLALVISADATVTLSGLAVPANSWPRVGMLNTSGNQDGCKGAIVGLDYAASGSQVQS